VTVRVRIAPSPTGNLHIGTARTAVFNWLYARHHGGQFILRIEDTDTTRSRPEYTQNILDGLAWLGLNWDEGPTFQSKRLDLYRQATQTLLDKGLAYRSYDTEAELEEMRAAQKARKEAPRYDNRHRNLTSEQRAAFEAEGRKSVIRFIIDDDREIVWNDLVRGKVTWKGSDLGGDMVIARSEKQEPDPPSDDIFFFLRKKPIVTFVLIILAAVILGKLLLNVFGAINDIPLLPTIFKSVGLGYTIWFVSQSLLFADKRHELSKKIEVIKKQIIGTDPSPPSSVIGQPLYNLAVVVDDIDMQITHVIRGEDHIANTAKQILLYEALGAAVPEFAHTPLILNEKGQKLSKRDGVTSISDFKEMGFKPEALVNYMTLLGWSPPDSTQEIFTLEEAAHQFSFERVNKAGAKFDWAKLDWLNGQYLHAMPAPQLVELLIPYWQKAGFEFDPVSDRAWLEQLAAVIGPSLARLPEAVEMSRMLFTESVEFSEEAAAQMKKEGASEVVQAILDTLDNYPELSSEQAQEIIKTVTKEKNVKKGLVMRSLRAGLTGDVNGPDLVESWVLLHQQGIDKTRLQKALSLAA
jgi:glutamyl/glutaminyl-tRNA synthetase